MIGVVMAWMLAYLAARVTSRALRRPGRALHYRAYSNRWKARWRP